MQTEVYALGPLCAFLSAATWAIGGSLYSKLSLTHSSPSINFTRAMVAFPIFVICSVFISLKMQSNIFTAVTSDHVFWLLVSNVSSYALADVLFYASTRILGIPSALAIASSYPLLAALAAWAKDGQTLSTTNSMGLLIVVLSISFIVKMGAPKNEKKTNRYFRGVLLAFATACFWALNSYSSAKGGSGISPFAANTIRMGTAALLCPIIGFAINKKWNGLLPLKSLKPYLWIFILESFGGSLLYIYGMANSSIAVGAALTSLAPALSMPVAIALKLEKFSLKKAVAIAFTVIGIWLLI